MFQKSTSNILPTTTNSQNTDAKPCLVQAANEAEQGFSVLYKGKFLYSKYAPKKAILQTIENLDVLEGTVFLCFSPILLYGVKELLEKINKTGGSSIIFLVEKDQNLFEIEKEEFEKNEETSRSEKIFLITPDETSSLPNYLWSHDLETLDGKKIPAPGTFRRVVPLNMSGGSQFFTADYARLFQNCQNVISTFWKNRITLAKLGRLFSKNLFKNLPLLAKSEKIENYFGTVGSEYKPILVLGAGPSLNETLENIKRETATENQKSNCPVIVAVDAALPVLKSYGIKPDFVVALESQLAVEKCYIGVFGGDFLSETVFLSDLTSRPQLNRRFEKFGKLAFFSTAYTESRFYKSLKEKNILPYQTNALGSVGLSAVSLALKLRKNENVKVFTSGLDFSYNLDTTHAKGTAQQKANYFARWRCSSPGAIGSCFKAQAKKFVGIGEIEVFSDAALLSYAESFKNEFSRTKNLFNAGKIGLDLGIECADILNHIQNPIKTEKKSSPISTDPNATTKINSYIEQEKKALLTIKEILIGEKNATTEELQELIEPREYLFLHFPDGHKCDASNISFLKRIRTEIDWFLRFLDSD